MQPNIIITSAYDLRSQYVKLGLSGKVKQIKCVQHMTASKTSAVSAGGEATTGISTIMKRAFDTKTRAFFYMTSPGNAMMLKLGVDDNYCITSFIICDSIMFWLRVRMAEVVAILTNRALFRIADAKFEDEYEQGHYNGIRSPIITQARIAEAYTSFKSLVDKGISKETHPMYFRRLSRDRGICAAGISECVKRVQ